MQTTKPRRTYDHRIKQAILESGDRDLFPELEIPKSTVRSCIHRGVPDAITSELVNCDRSALIAEIHALRQRTTLLAAIVGLLVAMLRVSKNGLDYERYADGASKAVLLRAVDRASKMLPLSSALRVVRLSASRYYSWSRVETWARPRRRLYPAKPKIGIRARAPGELLHVDVRAPVHQRCSCNA